MATIVSDRENEFAKLLSNRFYCKDILHLHSALKKCKSSFIDTVIIPELKMSPLWSESVKSMDIPNGDIDV